MEKNHIDIFKDIPSYGRFLKVNEIDNLVNLITELPGVNHKIIGKKLNDDPLIILDIGNSKKTRNAVKRRLVQYA